MSKHQNTFSRLTKSRAWPELCEDVRGEYVDRICRAGDADALLVAARELQAWEKVRERIESRAYDPDNQTTLEVV